MNDLKEQWNAEHIETLENKARTKKPVIISMGMGGSRKKLENIFINANAGKPKAK